eukprot:gnl/MRDRNA2_/MRDRNA2_27480_c0_seq1.p1 gnl/MRDRNA2_/MRDRNA2_27480_c0~~gnl/MRDRNA2_/MRDRNA2_27480_c0_seq1.p1  ORF type:complete len:307 (-),score=48.75 gnl/MRDRNA2_/MRDRNA2_27480_c0_seq1:52-972(-)
MRRTSVVILLSSVVLADATSIDNLALADKLIDRAFVTWSLQHGFLEDAMHAKPGAKLSKNPGLLSIEQPPTSPLKSPSKSLSAVSFSPAFRRSPVNRASRASVNQFAVPVLTRKEGLLQRLARAKAWAGEGLRYLADRLETPAQNVHIAGLTPPETPRGQVETKTSDQEGSLGNLGRVAPSPGELPDFVAPDNAASIHIAGLTPIKLVDSKAFADEDFGYLGGVGFSPNEAASISIAGLTPIKESKIGDQAVVLGKYREKETVQKENQQYIDIDSIVRDIDSDIMNSPRRKKFLAPARSKPSDSQN